MKTSLAFAVAMFFWGFILGTLVERGRFPDTASLIFFLAALALIAALSWLEAYTHRRRLIKWDVIRQRGRSAFIFLRYVPVRWLLISGILITILSSKFKVEYIVGFVVVPLFLVLAFAGYHEWRNCEEEYSVGALERVHRKLADTPA